MQLTRDDDEDAFDSFHDACSTLAEYFYEDVVCEEGDRLAPAMAHIVATTLEGACSSFAEQRIEPLALHRSDSAK